MTVEITRNTRTLDIIFTRHGAVPFLCRAARAGTVIPTTVAHRREVEVEHS